MKRSGHLLQNLIPIIPILAILIPVILFRRRLSAILIPIAMAALLSYMLDPAVDFTQKHLRKKNFMTRSKACALVFTVFLVLILAAAAFLVPAIAKSIADIIENEDFLKERLISCVNGIVPEKYVSVREKVSELAGSLYGFIERKLSQTASSASSVSSYGKISDFAVGIVSSLVITYYFLRDKTAILNGIYGLFPYRWRSALSETANELGMISAKFIQGQFLVAIIIGTVETIGLLILDIPYALLLGVIGGLSNMVPYFGPFIGAVPSVITALMISPVKTLWVILLFIIVQQIDNQFISPKIIEGNLGVHPITIIIIVFIGEEFFGLWGIIAAVPVYAMVKCILKRVIRAFRFQAQL